MVLAATVTEKCSQQIILNKPFMSSGMYWHILLICVLNTWLLQGEKNWINYAHMKTWVCWHVKYKRKFLVMLRWSNTARYRHVTVCKKLKYFPKKSLNEQIRTKQAIKRYFLKLGSYLTHIHLNIIVVVSFHPTPCNVLSVHLKMIRDNQLGILVTLTVLH